MGDWTSVEDKLPEASYPHTPGKWVLGWDSARSICVFVCRTHIDHEESLWDWVDESGSYHGGTFSGLSPITHWMPLPDGPRLS